MSRFASYLAVALASAALTLALRGDPAASPAQAGPEAASDYTPDERAAVTVYRDVNRSVVHITTRGSGDDLGLFAEPRSGAGSGCILDRQGHVLTNAHVLDNAGRIDVTLHGGRTFEAELIGRDPNNDLAVVRIDAPAELLEPITWGDSNQLVVGVRVFAIGNPFGLQRTLTMGIVSSLNRTLRTDNNRLVRGVIQTDAAINPGNSGGPLLDKRGAMVGITTAIISQAGQSSGVGLAVPANTARRVVDELIRFGRVIRGDCGIIAVYETDDGLLVARLTPDGPAERAGLRGPQPRMVRRGGFAFRMLDRSQADLIVGVDGRDVNSLDDLIGYVEARRPGQKVVLKVIRKGQTVEVPVVLGEPAG
jgi:S1-C subfamily serine protease